MGVRSQTCNMFRFEAGPQLDVQFRLSGISHFFSYVLVKWRNTESQNMDIFHPSTKKGRYRKRKHPALQANAGPTAGGHGRPAELRRPTPACPASYQQTSSALSEVPGKPLIRSQRAVWELHGHAQMLRGVAQLEVASCMAVDSSRQRAYLGVCSCVLDCIRSR